MSRSGRGLNRILLPHGVIEPLEARTLLALFTWVGGSGNWNDPTHWSSTAANTLPGADDSVLIGPGVTITVPAGTSAQCASASISADLRLLAGAQFGLFGGAAVPRPPGSLTLNGTFTMAGGTFTGHTQTTIDGNGTILFEGTGGSISAQANGTSLALGPGLTIRNGTSRGTIGGHALVSRATIIVEGTDPSGIRMTGIRQFTNLGTIQVSGSALTFDHASWTNAGTINITGGTLSLRGTYRQSDLGNYTRTGGTVRNEGTLQGNLALDALSGSWIGGGTLVGGRLTTREGARFTVGSGTTFDDYTLASDLAVVSGGFGVKNTLTLEGVTLTLQDSRIDFFSPANAISGSGQILCTSAAGGGATFAMFTGGPQVSTIGAGIAVRAVAGSIGFTAGGTASRLAIEGSVAIATSRTLNLGVATDLSGEIIAPSGAIVNLNGTLNVMPTGRIDLGGAAQLELKSRSILNAATSSHRMRLGGIASYSGGTAAVPQTLEAAAQDRGPAIEGYRGNFAMGVLRAGSNGFLRLVDSFDNSPGGGAEAIYADSVIVEFGATLDLSGRTLYARSVELQGTGQIIGGAPIVLPDAGPILFATPTSGRIAAAGERDDWTFFGRSGQTVSAVMNPTFLTTPGSPPAPNPTLTVARLSLLAPGGMELASVQGQMSTLQPVTLPADGIYTLRMAAPANEPNRTGGYNLALYDVTAETRPLTLNEVTSGAIETPFTRDRWTFSLEAAQQIQFDLVAARTSGLQFTLEGPDGFVAFSNLADDSTLITIPPGRGGSYVLTVRAQADQTGSYSFVVRDGSITPLTLGVPFAGALPGSDSSRWFQVTLPNPGQLLLRLDDSSSGNRNQLYLRRGALPTRGEFDYRSPGFVADAEIYLPDALPGEWYILLYGDHVPAPGGYTLAAEYSDLRITAITPDRYGVDNTMTMTVTGGGFEPGASLQLISGTLTLDAAAVEIDSFTRMTATFNLAGLPQALFDLRVASGVHDFTLLGAFRTLPDAPARLETTLHMPGSATRTSASTFSIEYANTGNVAMPAPLLIVQDADPEGDQHPILSLDLTRTFESFWATTMPQGVSERVMMLGSGAVAGVLNPGERMSIPIQYLGEKPPFETTDLLLQLEVRCIAAGEPGSQDPVDWAGLEDDLRPPTIPPSIWDPVYAGLTGPLATVEDYARMLRASAAYLDRIGVRVVDVDELWAFEVQKAMGTITMFPTLAGAVDLQVSAPGTPLSFTRHFADGLISRNTDGPFGFGWSVPWFARLTSDATGDVVTLNSGSGSQRIFLRDGRGSTPLNPSSAYFSAAGDAASLARVAPGIFELRDTGGVVTRFGEDGRIDHVRDLNGNRVTADYDASGKLVALSHSAGGSIAIDYNAAGRIALVSDSLGHAVTYAYDASGDHLVSATTDDGSQVSYTYDADSPAILRRHALLSERVGGTARVYAYDERGRVSSTSLEGGAQHVAVSYDQGRVTLADAGGPSHFYFDHRLRVAKMTNALGFSSAMHYDEHDRLSETTLPDGSRQRYEWCDCGSLISSVDSLGSAATYARDPRTREVTSITDGNGNISRMTYDAAGNRLALIHADGTSESAGNYTASGLARTFTNRRGQTTTFVYDAAGRVTRQTSANGVATDYAYDLRGRLTTVTQGASVTSMAYDTAGDGDRLKRVTYPNGRFVEFDHDDFGRRTAIRDQSGFATRYEYDAAGRLLHVRDASGIAMATYAYDAAGRIIRIDNGNGTFTTYAYDAAGQVLAIENYRSQGVLNSRFTYTYDSRGRRLTAGTPEGTWSYGYDAASQLTRATFASTSPARTSRSATTRPATAPSSP